MTVFRAASRAAANPVATVRVAAWTRSSVRALGTALARDGITAMDAIPAAPEVAADHRATVVGVLGLMGATCLVRSAVLQRWDADHDRARPLIIGVSKENGEFKAHAWLDGERSGAGFVELHRRPPTGRRAPPDRPAPADRSGRPANDR